MFYKIKKFIRTIWLKEQSGKLTNKNCSIISMNCVGGCVCHDYGIRFNSPTVNVYMSANDYIKFCENLAYYLEQSINFIDTNEPYPVGLLGDITIHFVHYHSTEDAEKKWEERKLRINWDNLFFIMCERDGCDESIMKRFDKLKYENKIVFTHKKYEGIKSSFVIKGFEHNDEIGNIIDFKRLSFKRYYDSFDFLSWFN